MENELTPQQQALVVGRRRRRDKWTSLVRREDAVNFGGRAVEADIEAVMIHLESEGTR